MYSFIGINVIGNEFNHGCEVEDLAIFNNGSLFVSVGGTYTKLWDVRKNSSPVNEISSNTKSVSCVNIIESGKRVLTGSYDQFFKVYDNELRILHQKKMPNAIMNMGISYNMETITFGYANGVVNVLHRNLKDLDKDMIADSKEKNQNDWEYYEKKLIQDLRIGVKQEDRKSRKFFGRGLYAKPGEFDVKIDQNNSKRLQKYDKLIRKFRYGDAQRHALLSKNTIVILSVFEELQYRNAIRKTLEKKDAEFYRHLQGFLLKKIDSGNCQKQIMFVLDEFFYVFDYKQFANDSVIDDLQIKLRAKVDKEVKIVNKTIELKGIQESLDL